MNQKNDKISRYEICKEFVTTIPVVIYTKKDFYLLNALDEKIRLLKAAGLIDFWNFQDVDKRFLNDPDPKTPKTLQLHHLFGCFQILIAGWLVGLANFVVEIFWQFTQKSK